MIEGFALDLIVQHLCNLPDKLAVKLAIREPGPTGTLVALANGRLDVHLTSRVFDRFHVRHHVLGFEMLDGGFVDGFVEVGARFDGFGPRAIAATFVDYGVDDFLLGGEGAVSVWRGGEG